MGKINKNYYDDAWIIENAPKYKRWSEMHLEYLRTHPNHQINIKNFRQHLNKRLRLTHRYTAEMDAWLLENYPHLGARESYKQLCEKFNVTKGYQGFLSHLQEIGAYVTEKRWRESCKNNGHRENVPVGTICLRGRGENYIKVGKGSDGWMRLSHYRIGKPEKGKYVIHLDGNKANDEIDNLKIINQTVMGLMTGNNFWSEDPVLNKTAVLCCELEDLVQKEREK